LLGVTTLDVVRTSTFIAEVLKNTSLSPSEVKVPVVGGHSGITVLFPRFYHRILQSHFLSF
jgi:malate/lactate dehydrogenase